MIQQRSVTKIFETEETNKHSFSNVGEDAAHVSGIYRWLDKKYTAQLFNYGKRMMFEFIIPEPAAFYVESRIRHYEATLDCPQKPQTPDYKILEFPFKPDDYDSEEKFLKLSEGYDLSEFEFPALKKTVSFINRETQQAFFSEKDLNANDIWYAKTYTCNLKSKGYQIVKIRMDGSLYWIGAETGRWRDLNFFNISINGAPVVRQDWSSTEYKAMYVPNDDVDLKSSPLVLFEDEIEVILGFQEIDRYALVVTAELEISPQKLRDWQMNVYRKIKAIKQKKVDEENREKELRYNSAMATYENRIAELKAQAINDLLQGQSEAFNREIILTEFKRACLAMLTKEFDADSTDDLLTSMEAMGQREICFQYRRLQVCESESKPDCETETESCCGDEAGKRTICTFEPMCQPVKYPLVDLTVARKKGRYIQFLEQAFEWRQLAYLCYPYFWTPPPKWIDLMNRSDDADPNLTAFLKAGSARVLIAVTPGYDEAVMHFIATREPWEGGPSPVIGDPLFIPLYEEIRKQQDDLAGARPCGAPWTFTVPTSLVYLDKSEKPFGDEKPMP